MKLNVQQTQEEQFNMARRIKGIDGLEIAGSQNSGLGIPEPTTDGNNVRTKSGSTLSWSQTELVSSTEKNTWNGKQNSLGFTPENITNKGLANGYVPLDSSSKIASIYLPSTVGDRFIINKTASWSITQTEVNDTIAGSYSGITYVYNSTTAGNFTVPVLTVPLGFTIRVHVINTGMVTVVASSTTINSRDNLLKSVAQHSAFELELIATNIYQLAGDLV